MNQLPELTAADLAALPPEVQEVMQQRERMTEETRAALGVRIAALRDDAVKARKASGIEDVWRKCEEAYIGIDDTNRHEFSSAEWAKPMAMDAPLVTVTRDRDDDRATAFVRVTSRYVDAGSAKAREITLPLDGRPFALKATPVPELAAAQDDEREAGAVAGQPMPGPDGQPVTVATLAKHVAGKAETAAELAADRIHDWMVEAKHSAIMRRAIFDMARIGTCVVMGPVPERRKAMRISKAGGRLTVEFVETVAPGEQLIDPWCFYPAPGCGEDIHRGGWAVYVDPMLPAQLRALARDEGTEANGGDFLADAINQVLKEGPSKAYTDGGNPNQKERAKGEQFMVWHFHGEIKRADFAAANPLQAAEEWGDDEDCLKGYVHAIVTLVNETVIRAVIQPLESGRLPFHVGRWRPRKGSWTGVGVAEQVDAPQRIVNGATRAMLNNGAKAAGSQVVMLQDAVVPANGQQRITPDKLWWLKTESGTDDVRKAFAAFQWPNMTPQLMSIVEYGFKLAEEHSSIPLITQGQSGKTTPDTFGGQQLQDNNANQLLRDVGADLNDDVTTPLVERYYEWLLLDPAVPDEEKGDYKVDTSGALALIEKALQDQTIQAMGAMVANPAFRIDPAKWFAAWARSKRLVPTEFQYTEDEWKKVSEAPPPKAPAVEAAEIRAKAQVAVAKSRDELTAHKIDVDTDRDRVYNQVMAGREAANAQARMEELALQREIATLNYQSKLADFAMKREISLQQAKTELAKTTMELNVQRELAGADRTAEQVADTDMEPVGRAEPGKAFQQ